MGKPIEVNDKDFDETVIKASVPILVDFWAPWCAPCRMVAPVVEELANEYEGKAGFVKVNVDGNPMIAARYGIQSIPTLILFKDGKPMQQIVGFRPKSELKKHLDAALV